MPFLQNDETDNLKDFTSIMDTTAINLHHQQQQQLNQQQHQQIGLTIGKSGLPLDLSKTTLKYEPSESEVSYSDSNNEHDESNDYFIPYFGTTTATPATPSSTTNNHENDINDIKMQSIVTGLSHIDSNLDNFSPVSPASSTQSKNKRYRTQMSNLQVKILKNLFIHFKTPSMIDCENIGREIGLQKRVIQVNNG